VKHEKVLERVYNPWRVRKAWRQIRDNAGAAGIDKMTVEDFEEREDELLGLIYEKLKGGIYRFKPARRVLIPKEGTAKMRKLGIPVVMDRIVAQSITSILHRGLNKK
jgi:RNA-directed DNA polymerase